MALICAKFKLMNLGANLGSRLARAYDWWPSIKIPKKDLQGGCDIYETMVGTDRGFDFC